MFFSLLKALAVTACLFLPRASSHGYMTQPPSRNYIAYQAGQDYDVMSLNNGGPWAMWPNGGWYFDGENSYICGRAQYDSNPGPIVASYKAGDVIDITVVITASHRGRFYFQLCPSPIATHNCPRLTNPLDGSDYWAERGTGTFTFQMKLPQDLACSVCSLRWYWITENSCSIDGSGVLSPCGGPAVPEEFFNCATVRVIPLTPPAAQPSPIPSPKPPTFCTRLKSPNARGKTFLCAPLKSGWMNGFKVTAKGPVWWNSKAKWVKAGRPFSGTVNCAVAKTCFA